MPLNDGLPKLEAPAGTCDTHMHIYDSRYPTAPTAAFTPPDATVAETNWPHPTPGLQKPDDAWTLDMMHEWVPDEATRRKALVDNPARLYGF